MTVFYLFPCRSSWWTCFLPWPHSNGSNLSSKIVNIGFFGKRRNLSNCFGQIRGGKNKKSKFRRTHFGKGAERIVLHLKIISVAARKVLYFCDRFWSEKDRLFFSKKPSDQNDRSKYRPLKNDSDKIEGILLEEHGQRTNLHVILFLFGPLKCMQLSPKDWQFFKVSTFSTFEKTPTDHWKKCVTKFQK